MHSNSNRTDYLSDYTTISMYRFLLGLQSSLDCILLELFYILISVQFPQLLLHLSIYQVFRDCICEHKFDRFVDLFFKLSVCSI